MVLDWADFDVEAKNYNLIITARELWLAAKDTSKYKYNKNLKPRIEDIPKMVLKRFTTESIRLAGRELCQEAFYLLIGSSYYTVGKLAKECTNSGGHILTKVCSPSAFVLIS